MTLAHTVLSVDVIRWSEEDLPISRVRAAFKDYKSNNGYNQKQKKIRPLIIVNKTALKKRDWSFELSGESGKI